MINRLDEVNRMVANDLSMPRIFQRLQTCCTEFASSNIARVNLLEESTTIYVWINSNVFPNKKMNNEFCYKGTRLLDSEGLQTRDKVEPIARALTLKKTSIRGLFN